MLDREYETMRKVEDTYWWYRVLRGMTARAAARYLSKKDDASVLDAGCGTGGTLDELQRTGTGWRLHGFDFSPLAVEHTQSRGFTDVKLGSVNEIEEPASTVDAIISLDVICCKGVDVGRAFAEFHRVLKPGGILILNLPAFQVLHGRHDVAVHLAHRFTAAEVRQLHEQHGFDPITIHYWNAWLFLPILGWRLITRLIAKNENAADAESDLKTLPAPLNAALQAAGTIESRLCGLIRPPFGTSVFSVARKPVST